MILTSGDRSLTWPAPPACGLAELLHQVDIVVAVRIAWRAAAFGVAGPAIETGCLEGVGAEGYPVAAAAPDLSFGCGEELRSQTATALVVAGAVAAPVSCATPSAMRMVAPPAMVPSRNAA